jgi:hypothetical protein
MKKSHKATILALLAVVAGVLLMQSRATPVPTRPVHLIVTGPSGERFTGSYIADGITNTFSAAVPATITCWARTLTYEIQPADNRQEFRVALDVEQTHRTSFISYKGKPVKGGWRYTATEESAW